MPTGRLQRQAHAGQHRQRQPLVGRLRRADEFRHVRGPAALAYEGPCLEPGAGPLLHRSVGEQGGRDHPAPDPAEPAPAVEHRDLHAVRCPVRPGAGQGPRDAVDHNGDLGEPGHDQRERRVEAREQGAGQGGRVGVAQRQPDDGVIARWRRCRVEDGQGQPEHRDGTAAAGQFGVEGRHPEPAHRVDRFPLRPADAAAAARHAGGVPGVPRHDRRGVADGQDRGEADAEASEGRGVTFGRGTQCRERFDPRYGQRRPGVGDLQYAAAPAAVTVTAALAVAGAMTVGGTAAGSMTARSVAAGGVAAGQRYEDTAVGPGVLGRVHGVLEQFHDEAVVVGAAGGVLLGVRVLAEAGGGGGPGVQHPAADGGRPERVVRGCAAGARVHDHVPVRLRVHRPILLFDGPGQRSRSKRSIIASRPDHRPTADDRTTG